MYKKGIVIYIVLISLIGLAKLPNIYAAEKYAATVNGIGIKNAAMEAAMTNFIENQKLFGVQLKEEEKTKLRQDILNELIQAELLYQKSKEAGLGDLDEEISNQFDSIKKGFKSEAEFKKILSDRGITVNDLKDDIKKGVFIKTFIEKELYKNINVTEEEKLQEYEKTKDKLIVPELRKVQHILLKVSKDTNEQDKSAKKAKIEEIRKKAVAGEDFAALAKENSEDRSAPNGGELDYFAKGEVVEPFGEITFKLKEGEISSAFETEFGYHVVKLLNIQPTHTLGYDEVRKEVETFLTSTKKKEVLDKYVDELKKNAKIVIY